MTSTAISAQGSTLKIGTGTGGAKTVSAVAVGNPTILTSSSHGLSDGQVVTLGAFSDTDAATLNGKVVSVTNVTTNTFAVQIDTTGKTITGTSATATPVTYTQVANVKTFTGFDGAASELDKTNLDSTAKEFMLGLVDPGHFTITFDKNLNDTGQTALMAARVAGTIQNFIYTAPDASTASFQGYVKTFTTDGGVDKIITAQSQIRISGPVTLG